MNIAIYLDLPDGGAKRTMDEIIPLLSKNNKVSIFSCNSVLNNSRFRLLRDIDSLFVSRILQKKLANIINRSNFDICFVTHDRHLQSPWILRYLRMPVVFLCQEPTRAFFEKFLDIDKKLPFLKLIYEKLNRQLRKQAEVENAQYSNKIIANSYYSVESIFRAYGKYATPIYLGVNLKTFYPQKNKYKNQVIIVGNNEPQKSLRLAVESLSLLPVSTRPVLFIACPRKNSLSEVIKFAKNNKVKLKIKYGLCPADLAKEYQNSLATLACASLEPFGLSVVESLACGTPVVAVKEGGFRETIKNGYNGFLVERDPQKISNAIEKLIKDKKLRQKLSHNCSAYAQKTYTWEKTVKKIENLMYEIT